MIWVKTEAGRAEMQDRALVKERALRNLLVLIDGTKSEATLLRTLTGLSPDAFGRLEALGLIAPLVPASRVSGGVATTASRAEGGDLADPAGASAPGATTDLEFDAVAPLDYAAFTATLTQLISKELGLRGLMLTLAVEKAGTIEALRAVGEKVIAQIGERRGEAAAAAARQALYGVS